MQFIKKITDALDSADNGGNGGKGNNVVESSPSTAQATSPGPEGSSLIQCNNATRGAGGEWEVIPPPPGSTSTPTVAASGDVGTDGETRSGGYRATDAIAEEAARILRSAATAAEALAPRLSSTLRRAEAAEAEVLRLRAVIENAEARIKELEKQQDRLTEGFIKEIQQRDAEIATFKASAASSEARGFKSPRPPASSDVDANEAIEVLTFTEEGKLGIEFDQTNDCLKILSFVAPGSQSEGRLFVGDEVISVSGACTRNLSWEEMVEVLAARPVVISVRREGSGSKPSNPFLKTLAGWTRAFAARNAKESKENDEDGVALDYDSLEVCNRPFFELVRASISEAVASDSNTSASEEEQFEQWLRQFHSERDDEWYASNHVRLINAFKPHWDEVVEAHRALAAS